MGDEQITRAEWNRLQQTADDGFREMRASFNEFNGRVRRNEEDIRVLWDRSEDAKVGRWIDRGVGGLVALALGIKGFFIR